MYYITAKNLTSGCVYTEYWFDHEIEKRRNFLVNDFQQSVITWGRIPTNYKTFFRFFWKCLCGFSYLGEFDPAK